MYYNITVPVPSVKGKIITKVKGNTTYVLFQYGQEYKPEKKYSVPKRSIIGKLDPSDPLKMYPNDKFHVYFPDEPLPDILPEAQRSCALKIGGYAVIQKVLLEYGLPKILEKYFQKDCGLLLDLVSYLLIEEDNAGQYYPDFAFNHPLFSDKMRIYSDSKVSRLLNSITKDQIVSFLSDWNAKRDHKQRIYISYDSTNKNSQAGDIDLVEYGKAKDDRGVPVVNIALAFDKTNKVPLFYEDYPGSVNDVSQFEYMISKVQEYGYHSVGFILDRGYFSKANIRFLEENGYPFIIMVKGKKTFIADLIKKNKNTFETDRNCSIRAYRVYGKTLEGTLFEDDTQDRYFHLYFNPSRQAAEREQLEQTIDRMALYLSKHIGEDITLPKSYHDYFNIRYNKKHILTSYKERKDIIEDQLERCGYFCIITSEEMTAAEALIHYKGRDVSEKLFCADKKFLGSRCMRVHSSDSFEGKLFIEFLALIVRNRIYNLLKETMLKLDTRQNYLTVPAAFKELEKIELVCVNGGRYQLAYAISKKQKTILSSFGMDKTDIERLSFAISNLLEKNRSLLTASDDEDDDFVPDMEEL